MSTIELIQDWSSRGLSFKAVDNQLQVAPPALLTNLDRQHIREHKLEIISFLDPPKFNREITVRAKQLSDDCCWDTCKGKLSRVGMDTWKCPLCNYIFRLKPPDDEELNRLWQKDRRQ